MYLLEGWSWRSVYQVRQWDSWEKSSYNLVIKGCSLYCLYTWVLKEGFVSSPSTSRSQHVTHCVFNICTKGKGSCQLPLCGSHIAQMSFPSLDSGSWPVSCWSWAAEDSSGGENKRSAVTEAHWMAQDSATPLPKILAAWSGVRTLYRGFGAAHQVKVFHPLP